jgi:hypothetical protein
MISINIMHGKLAVLAGWRVIDKNPGGIDSINMNAGRIPTTDMLWPKCELSVIDKT